MFIPSWVIIPLVSIIMILLIASVYMFCYMKNRVNSISEKLVDISQDLKNCAGKVNSEPKVLMAQLLLKTSSPLQFCHMLEI